MDFFKLPESTEIGKVIHKNTFNLHFNTTEKKLLTDVVSKMTWNNKISSETVNLPFNKVDEIQVFKIDLKRIDKISALLQAIDTHIPYHIIFILSYKKILQLSVSVKQPHPSKQSSSIIDWTFNSDWILAADFGYNLSLKRNIDFILRDLCFQLSGKNDSSLELAELIMLCKHKSLINKQISLLESRIKKCKQFNLKVELNLRLHKLKEKLENFNS